MHQDLRRALQTLHYTKSFTANLFIGNRQSVPSGMPGAFEKDLEDIAAGIVSKAIAGGIAEHAAGEAGGVSPKTRGKKGTTDMSDVAGGGASPNTRRKSGMTGIYSRYGGATPLSPRKTAGTCPKTQDGNNQGGILCQYCDTLVEQDAMDHNQNITNSQEEIYTMSYIY